MSLYPLLNTETCHNKLLSHGLFGAMMTNSSSIDSSHGADEAVLTIGMGYWQPATNAFTEWFQVSNKYMWAIYVAMKSKH